MKCFYIKDSFDPARIENYGKTKEDRYQLIAESDVCPMFGLIYIEVFKSEIERDINEKH